VQEIPPDYEDASTDDESQVHMAMSALHGVSWSVLEAIWSEVDTRIQQLQQHCAPTAADGAGAALADGASSAPTRAPRGKQQSQQKQQRGQGGQLPPSQALALSKAREAIVLEKRLAIYLLGMRVLAAWIAERGLRASDSSQTSLLEKAIAGVMQLLRAEFSSSHSAAVGVVYELSRLSPALQSQLQARCLEALGSVSASLSTTSAYKFGVEKDKHGNVYVQQPVRKLDRSHHWPRAA
jgi:hypothetical protein